MRIIVDAGRIASKRRPQSQQIPANQDWA